jgi:hypothetical protein
MKAPSSAIWPLLRMCCTDRPVHTLEGSPTISAAGSNQLAVPSGAPPQAVSRAPGADPVPFLYARPAWTSQPQASGKRPARATTSTKLRAS